jgi:outer membrane lipoprotein SlyB
MIMKTLMSAAAFGTAFFLSGCTTTYGPMNVSASAVGQPANVNQGTVIAVRPITIRQERSGVGAATGAAVGWLVGSELGNSSGGIIGSIVGGAAGNEVGKNVNAKTGLAVTVDFGNGNVREIVQPANVAIRVGQVVNVSYRSDGAFIYPAY